MLKYIFLFFPIIAHANCGSEFCLIDSHTPSDNKYQLDIRYEYINQNKLLGTSNEDHTEVYTKNKNLIYTLNYTHSPNYGLSVIVPYVKREHLHLHNEPEYWSFQGFSDIKLLGHYNPSNSNFGFDLGFKFPTGSYQKSNSENEIAELGVQPGNGNTDIILGTHYIYKNYSAQLFYQKSIEQKTNYKAASALSFTMKANYPLTSKLSTSLQLNTLIKNRTETADGGKFLFFSPGVQYKIFPNTSVYAFIQFPVYRNVTDAQLVPKNAFVVGFEQNF